VVVAGDLWRPRIAQESKVRVDAFKLAFARPNCVTYQVSHEFGGDFGFEGMFDYLVIVTLSENIL